MRLTATFIVSLGVLLIPAIAKSENNGDKVASRALLRRGNELLDQGKFQEALDNFQEAYKKYPSAKIFFSEGQAFRGLNQNAAALRAFQRFIGEVPDAKDDHKDEANRQISDLNKRVGKIEVHSNRIGSIIRVDGEIFGETPLATPVVVDLGLRHVEVEWQGNKKTERVDALAEITISLQMDFAIQPGQLTLRCNQEGAVVFLNGKNWGLTPLAHPLSLPPGEYGVTLEWLKQKKSIPLMIAEGEVVSKTIDFVKSTAEVVPLTVQPKPSRPILSTREWFHSPWVWGAAGALVVGVGTTLVLMYGQSDRYPATTMGTQPIGK